MIRADASTNDRPRAWYLFIKRWATHELSRALTVIRATVALVLAAVLGLAGCSDVQHVVLGACGNRIVEDGEDCDGASGCNNSCRFSCREPRDCPTGWGCDVAAGICRVSRGTFRAVSLAAERYSSLLVADFDQDGRDDLPRSTPTPGSCRPSISSEGTARSRARSRCRRRMRRRSPT
jgi:hypothetical protein